MKEKRNKLQKEPGSVQRQIHKNESYQDVLVNREEQNSDEQSGIVSFSQVRKPHQKKSGTGYSELKEIDDEKIIPGIKTKRGPWNSVDFEADDSEDWGLV